jgi:hypothetical protein
MKEDKKKYTKINKKRNLPNNEDFLDVLSKSTNISSTNPPLTADDVNLSVNDNLVLEGTTNASTSQAIYGVNVITTSTASDLATRLPDPVTGKQTVFINNSLLPILVFPSVVGGEINGVVDGVASIPNDGRAYTFYCIENPLPGAWTWSPPAVGQIQVPTIEVAHTNGVTTNAYGVGVPGAQLINPPGPNWYDNVGGSLGVGGSINFTPSIDFWATAPLSPARTLIRTKVYSNFLATDGANAPQIQRKVLYKPNASGLNGYSASGVNLFGSDTVVAGPISVPSQVGDNDTFYKIVEANLINVAPLETDLIGVGAFSNHYYTFIIVIPSTAATKTYKFDIFLEHT